MEFELTPLPYPTNALEPHLSAETLALHHDRHHRAYLTKLAKLLYGAPEADLPLEEIVRRSNGAVFDNAAQVWNHDFFWRSMTPGGEPPGGELADAIEASFGGMDELRSQFVDAGAEHFGSGWLWIVADGDRLAIATTHDADTPLRHGRTALLTCDLWEHAYYVDYRNERERYLEVFFDHLAHWKFAADRFAATGSGARSRR